MAGWSIKLIVAKFILYYLNNNNYYNSNSLSHNIVSLSVDHDLR